MNISIPDSLQSFVDEQVASRGYGTSSEYLCRLIQRDQDQLRLRSLSGAAAASPAGTAVDNATSMRCKLASAAVRVGDR